MARKGPFICEICNKSCKNPPALDAHKKYKHPELFVTTNAPLKEPIITLTNEQIEQIVAKGLEPMQQKLSELEATLADLESSAERNTEIDRERRRAIGKAIKRLHDRIIEQQQAPLRAAEETARALKPFPLSLLK